MQKKTHRLLDLKTGNPCGCKRLKCWEVTSAEQRQALIDRFTGYQTKDEQDAFLASLIRVHPVAQRGHRQDENAANDAEFLQVPHPHYERRQTRGCPSVPSSHAVLFF